MKNKNITTQEYKNIIEPTDTEIQKEINISWYKEKYKTGSKKEKKEWEDSAAGDLRWRKTDKWFRETYDHLDMSVDDVVVYITIDINGKTTPLTTFTTENLTDYQLFKELKKIGSPKYLENIKKGYEKNIKYLHKSKSNKVTIKNPTLATAMNIPKETKKRKTRKRNKIKI